jgi:hypothetical protein
MALPATVGELSAALGVDGKLTALFYGNEFHPATGASVGVVSPMTGETLCQSGGASDDDVGAAVDVSSPAHCPDACIGVGFFASF